MALGVVAIRPTVTVIIFGIATVDELLLTSIARTSPCETDSVKVTDPIVLPELTDVRAVAALLFLIIFHPVGISLR